MHRFRLFCFAVLALATDPAFAQTPAAVAQPQGEPALRIEWEVKNRFRLFRNEADFQRHVAAQQGDSVLAGEARMQQQSDSRGWAREMVGRLCIDGSGKVMETCQRDGVRESYLSPADHRVAAVLAGEVPPGSHCVWNFDDGTIPPQEISADCSAPVDIRVRYGKPTIASVGVTTPEGGIHQAVTEIMVRDFLIAGLGDSIAAGEGNPDRPVALSDIGFCFRDFAGNEFYRPGRARYPGDKSCSMATGESTGGALREWQRHAAGWMSSACHRSLYGYQLRAALALAVENPQMAVTFLPLACAGATIDSGLLSSQRIRECPPNARESCSSSSPGQISQLTQLLAKAQRPLDLLMLTVGANDINFAGLVANVIIEEGGERTLFSRGTITTPEAAAKTTDLELPGQFAKLRAALKPLVGGNLSRVVFTTYGHLAMEHAGVPCPGGRDGFDIHPSFNVNADRLRRVSDFISNKFLPKIKALATCEGTTLCGQPQADRMTFVDGHQPAFEEHGFCARSEQDPDFDRECFSSSGESFVTDVVQAANSPLACGLQASDFPPYAPRARWVRTANDSYFTAMTYPEGASTVVQPANIHDALWGILSAVYGGAIHPTAEGHAAMADATLPAMRHVLDITPPPAITSAPLPPPLR